MKTTVGLLYMLIGSTVLVPQGGAGQIAAPRGTASVGIWTGVSWHAAGPSGVQTVGDREFVVVALRYRHVVLSSSRMAVAYTADFIPLAVATDNSSEAFPNHLTRGANVAAVASALTLGGGPVHRNTAVGVGVAPVGVEMKVSMSRRLGIVVGGTAGFIAFSKPVPFANARKINATLDVGIGLELVVGRRWTAIGGYKFHHLSNAGTGDLNPGLNARLWYLGTLTRW